MLLNSRIGNRVDRLGIVLIIDVPEPDVMKRRGANGVPAQLLAGNRHVTNFRLLRLVKEMCNAQLIYLDHIIYTSHKNYR